MGRSLSADLGLMGLAPGFLTLNPRTGPPRAALGDGFAVFRVVLLREMFGIRSVAGTAPWRTGALPVVLIRGRRAPSLPDKSSV